MTLEINKLKKIINQPEFPLALSNGKMGVCLSFYLLGRKLKNGTYSEFADDILEDILANAQNISSINLKDGLSGIGISLNFLVSNQYIEGDINYILKDSDDLIIRTLSPNYNIEFEPEILLDLLFYIGIRLENKSLDLDYKYLFQECAIEYLNKLYSKIDSDFFEESLPFTLDNKLLRLLHLTSLYYKLNFYTIRLDKLIDELSYNLLSYLPKLNSNKLLLIGGMSLVNIHTKLDSWQNHIHILKREFNFDILIHKEIREYNTSLCNGLAGIIYALSLSRQEFSEEKYSIGKNKLIELFDIDSIKKTILNPEEKDVSLLYGSLGELVIYNILKQ